MQRANPLLAVATVLAAIVFTAPVVYAQPKTEQERGHGHFVSGNIALSKGAYRNFAFIDTPAVTPGAPTSGVIAIMNVAAVAEIPIVTTTVTQTLRKRDVVKGKIGNKELLQLILDTTNASALKGQSLVWVTPGGGLLGRTVFGQADSGPSQVGAADLRSTNILVRSRQPGANLLGVGVQESGVSLVTSILPSKANTNERTATGYGFAALSGDGRSPISLPGVTRMSFVIGSAGPYKETYSQNPTTGVITNSSKGSFRSTSLTTGFIQPLP